MIYSLVSQTVAGGSSSLSADLLREITRIRVPPLCPELRVPGLPSGLELDGFRTTYEAHLGAVTPYWVIAWPGGQALARYLMDHPDVVRGRCVIDLGCGAGIVATAAMRAGAARAIAVDSDPNALCAARETARLNGVNVTCLLQDIEGFAAEAGSVVCAGDLWYERETARRATLALRRMAQDGHQILCGDPSRPERPKHRVVHRASYSVAVSQAFERMSPIECRVFELLALHMPRTHTAHASREGAHALQSDKTANNNPEGWLTTSSRENP